MDEYYDSTPTTPNISYEDFIRSLQLPIDAVDDDYSLELPVDDDSLQLPVNVDVLNAGTIFHRFQNTEGYEAFRIKHDINEYDIRDAIQYILSVDSHSPASKLNESPAHNKKLIRDNASYSEFSFDMHPVIDRLLENDTFTTICMDVLKRQTGGKSKKRTRKRSCKKCKTLKRTKGKKGRGRHLKSKRKSNRV